MKALPITTNQYVRGFSCWACPVPISLNHQHLSKLPWIKLSPSQSHPYLPSTPKLIEHQHVLGCCINTNLSTPTISFSPSKAYLYYLTSAVKGLFLEWLNRIHQTMGSKVRFWLDRTMIQRWVHVSLYAFSLVHTVTQKQKSSTWVGIRWCSFNWPGLEFQLPVPGFVSCYGIWTRKWNLGVSVILRAFFLLTGKHGRCWLVGVLSMFGRKLVLTGK